MAKNLFAQKIDPLVVDAINSYKRTFTKPQVLGGVLQNVHVARMMSRRRTVRRIIRVHLIVSVVPRGAVGRIVRFHRIRALIIRGVRVCRQTATAAATWS